MSLPALKSIRVRRLHKEKLVYWRQSAKSAQASDVSELKTMLICRRHCLQVGSPSPEPRGGAFVDYIMYRTASPGQ
jgi:hypothetical protein